MQHWLVSGASYCVDEHVDHVAAGARAHAVEYCLQASGGVGVGVADHRLSPAGPDCGVATTTARRWATSHGARGGTRSARHGGPRLERKPCDEQIRAGPVIGREPREAGLGAGTRRWHISSPRLTCDPSTLCRTPFRMVPRPSLLAAQHEDVGETVVKTLPPGWTQHSRGGDPLVGHSDKRGRQQRPASLERCNPPNLKKVYQRLLEFTLAPSMLAPQFIDISLEFSQVLQSPVHRRRCGHGDQENLRWLADRPADHHGAPTGSPMGDLIYHPQAQDRLTGRPTSHGHSRNEIAAGYGQAVPLRAERCVMPWSAPETTQP